MWVFVDHSIQVESASGPQEQCHRRWSFGVQWAFDLQRFDWDLTKDLLRTFDHLRLMRKSVTLAKCNWEWSSSGITLKWLFSLNKNIFETFIIQRRGADKSPLLRKRDSVQFNWLPMTRPWLFLNGVDCILIMTYFVVNKINGFIRGVEVNFGRP